MIEAVVVRDIHMHFVVMRFKNGNVEVPRTLASQGHGRRNARLWL